MADAILDPNVSFIGPITPKGIYGIDGYKRFALGWYEGFPDRRFELVKAWVDGDWIATAPTSTAPTGANSWVRRPRAAR